MTDKVNVPQGHMSINAFADISQSDSNNISAQVLKDGSVVLFAADKNSLPNAGGDTAAQQTQAKQFLFDAIETSYGAKVAAELFSHGGEGAHLFSGKPLSSEDITTLTNKAEALVNRLDMQPDRSGPNSSSPLTNDDHVTPMGNEPIDEEVQTSKIYSAISKFMDRLGEIFDKLTQRAVDSDNSLSQSDIDKLDQKDAKELIKDSLELDFENGSSIPSNKQLEDAAVETLVDMMKTDQDDGDNEPADIKPNEPQTDAEISYPKLKPRASNDDVTPNEPKNETQSNAEISYPKLKPRVSNDNVTSKQEEQVAVKEELEIEPKIKIDTSENQNKTNPANVDALKAGLTDPSSGKLEDLLVKAMNKNVPESLDPPSAEDTIKELKSMGLDLEKTRDYLNGGLDQLVEQHGSGAVGDLTSEQLEGQALDMIDQLFGKIFSSKSDESAASELPDPKTSARMTDEEIDQDIKDLEEAISRHDGNILDHKLANYEAGKQFFKEIESGVTDAERNGGAVKFNEVDRHSFLGIVINAAKAKAPENMLGDGGFKPDNWDANDGMKFSDMRKAVLLGFARHPEPLENMSSSDKELLMIDLIAKHISLPPDPPSTN